MRLGVIQPSTDAACAGSQCKCDLLPNHALLDQERYRCAAPQRRFPAPRSALAARSRGRAAATDHLASNQPGDVVYRAELRRSRLPPRAVVQVAGHCRGYCTLQRDRRLPPSTAARLRGV
jgi:hypothetical protein